MTNAIKDAKQFFLWDYSNTLFPLTTNRLMIEGHVNGIRTFLQEEVLTPDGAFLPQQRVFASKRGWLLRRTVKLDPVAEFFLYELIFRNRRGFRRAESASRQVFGFAMSHGLPLSAVRSYANFKKAVASGRATFQHHAYFDIASYFNHVYHHDLVAWFEELGAAEEDVQMMGKFLRETSGGRSVDCLPQGLYPAKMIGASYLSFLEASNRIRSKKTVRLMDDIWLFDNDKATIVSDCLRIQSLLGDRGLTINDSKSMQPGGWIDADLTTDVDDMKVHLLRKRREALADLLGYDDSNENDHPEDLDELTEEEQEYLVDLLRGDRIQEEDAELVLTLMKDHSNSVLEHVPMLVREFPGLSKKLYAFCQDLDDKDALLKILEEHVESDGVVTEYQLFWFAKMAEDYLMDCNGVRDLLDALHDHDHATDISRAKILENPSKKHGLPELRAEHLRSGHSGWLAWTSAVGSRDLAKGQRNQLLKYFRKASAMNKVIGEFVETCF